jgi:hypothetical protein
MVKGDVISVDRDYKVGGDGDVIFADRDCKVTSVGLLGIPNYMSHYFFYM